MPMLFDITYSVPYEGGNTINSLTVEEVLAWLDDNSFRGYSEDCLITPSNNPSFDQHSFRASFCKTGD